MPKTCLFSRALAGVGALRLAQVLAMSLAMSLAMTLFSAPASLADVFTVPPDITGDLDGTTGDDTITINNGGTVTGTVEGGGGNNTITNSGTVGVDIYGNHHADGNATVVNTATGKVGALLYGIRYGDGNVSVTNHGTVGRHMYGVVYGNGDAYVLNTGDVGSEGSFDLYGNFGGSGNVTVINRGSVSDDIYGHFNGDGKSIIINSGTVGSRLYGLYGSGHTGSTYIDNSGTVTYHIYGLIGSTGSAYIFNSGTVDYYIYGNYQGTGDVTIVNTGTVGDRIYGNFEGSGDVTITNSGHVTDYIYGHYYGDGKSTIINSGTVGSRLYGLYGSGHTGSTYIDNSGTVGADLYGLYQSTGSASIVNSGTVGNNLYGNYEGTGDVYIHNSGTVTSRIYGNSNGTGDVTINNSGSVSSRIYGLIDGTGDVTISNSGSVGGILYGNYEGSGDVTISNSGSVNLSLYGRFRGNGDVAVTNSGTVGANLYGNDQGTGDATITNTGTVGGSLYGVLNGTGNATIYNAGTVKGSIEAGPGNDKVTLAGGSKVSDLVVGGAGTDALYLQGGGVVQAPGAGISGFESVTMNGDSLAVYTGTWDFGTLTLQVKSGTHSIKGSMTAPLTAITSGSLLVNGNLYSSLTTITGGSLLVNGNLYSPVTLTGGILGGSGTVHGNVSNSGTISPGNSIGTLTINGDYTQNAGSFYLCEVNAKGQSDLLHVTGTADLQGGVVRVSPARGLYASGTKWTILTADGGITGNFSGFELVTPSQTLLLSTASSGGQVVMVLSRKPYAELAGTPNQVAVATTLDAILPFALAGDEGWAGFMTMLDFDYDLAQMRQAFKALSPEMYDAFSGAALNNARTFGLLMADRSRAARAATRLGQPDGAKGSGPVHASADELPAAQGMAGPAPNSGWSLWARTLGGWGYQDRSGEVNGYSLSTGGVVLGADGPVLPWLRLGVAMAAISTDFSWNGEHHEGDQQSIMAGVYATAGTGGLHLDGSLSYGSFDNSATRAIFMDGVSARARSSFDGTSILARLGGGYDFKAGNAVFGPMASLSYLRLEREGFSEHGADFLSLKVKEQTEDYTAGSLGFSAAWLWQRDDFSFMPRLAASWQHNFNAERREVEASFVDYGDHPFTVRGIAPAADLLTIEAGMTTRFTERFSAYLEYALSAGQGFQAHGFTAGVSWEF